MPNFPIFDPHLHLWDQQRLTYPWLAEVPALNRNFLLPDYRAACGTVEVGQMLFMQCDCLPEQGQAEAMWAASLAQEDDRLAGVVAFAPLEQGDAVRPYIEQLKINCLPLKGVRRLIQGEPNPQFCLEPDFVAGVKLLADYDLTFDLCFTADQLPAVVQLAGQVPDVKMVVDHIGKPDIEGEKFTAWAKNMGELAAMPQVHCKLSSLATAADHQQWLIDDLRPYVEHVLRTFGPEKCFFASDWPVCTLAADIPTCVQTLDALLHGLSDEALRDIYWNNGRAFYGMG